MSAQGSQALKPSQVRGAARCIAAQSIWAVSNLWQGQRSLLTMGVRANGPPSPCATWPIQVRGSGWLCCPGKLKHAPGHVRDRAPAGELRMALLSGKVETL